MRITYRHHGGSNDYWQERWANIPADNGKLNLDRYPGKFAARTLRSINGPVLEAGCGAGRVLLHYHKEGVPIVGIDFIGTAIDKIKQLDSSIEAYQADITNLPFEDEKFEAVLAFGLYHSLENGIHEALLETRRVLKPNGLLCASLRMDNIQNRINDWLADRKANATGPKTFHKANFQPNEVKIMLRQAGFETEKIEFVENMPLLYKFGVFRHKAHKSFDEHLARGEGYRLSFLGQMLQNALLKFFPQSFCNIVVVTARATPTTTSSEG